MKDNEESTKSIKAETISVRILQIIYEPNRAQVLKTAEQFYALVHAGLTSSDTDVVCAAHYLEELLGDKGGLKSIDDFLSNQFGISRNSIGRPKQSLSKSLKDKKIKAALQHLIEKHGMQHRSDWAKAEYIANLQREDPPCQDAHDLIRLGAPSSCNQLLIFIRAMPATIQRP